MTLRSLVIGAIAAASLSALFGAPARADELRCDSNVGAYKYCRSKINVGVALLYQHTRYACFQEDTWGFDGNGVWVSNGCSATFRTGENTTREDDGVAKAVGLDLLALNTLGIRPAQNARRAQRAAPLGLMQAQNANAAAAAAPPALIVRCEPISRQKSRCDVAVANDVQLTRQISKGRGTCRFNHTWGYDSRGIWVDKSCRAEFTVN